jgi:hypothetical protein
MSARDLINTAAVGCMLLSGACKSSSSEPEQPEAPVAQEPTSAAPAQAAPRDELPASAPVQPSAAAQNATDKLPTREELPVAEDFEQEVSDSIQSKNYRAQLDALEKELKADAR